MTKDEFLNHLKALCEDGSIQITLDIEPRRTSQHSRNRRYDIRVGLCVGEEVTVSKTHTLTIPDPH